MTILHIGKCRGPMRGGVSSVLPHHLNYQMRHANVAFYNIADYPSTEFKCPVYFKSQTPITELAEPFNTPDLVIFHQIYEPVFLPLSKTLKKRDIPYIVIPHGSLTRHAQSIKRIKKMVGNTLGFKRFLKNALAIQFLADNEQDVSIQVNSNSIISGNGIDVPKKVLWKYDDTKRLRLVYLGRLSYKTKGIDRMIDAVNILIQTGGNVSLSLVGPNYNNSLEKIKSHIQELRLEKHIKILNPVYGSKKYQRIAKGDCFIQLSRSEGQPMGIIEALSIGMPIIVTRGTAFYNIAKNNNVGFCAEDKPDEIATTLRDIIDNKGQLIAISKRARKYAELSYAWDTVAKDAVKKYRLLLK